MKTEKGIALVLSLFLMTAMSIIAASLMFLSQTETYSSLNYRLMSQARYGAESGIQQAANYLMNTYVPPGMNVNDPLANYDMTQSPVLYNGNPVILSANANKASNYPILAVQTAFNTSAQGSFVAGTTPPITISYAPYATLLNMQQVQLYGQTTMTTVMTWRITADGSIVAGKTATVEVSATLEQQVVPGDAYAAFATGGGCGSLSLGGGDIIDSYDSRSMTMVGGVPQTQQSGGNVGTNGNLTLSGQATVYGNLYTPRTGVGGCANGAPDAETLQSNNATLAGSVIELPQQVSLLTPVVPPTCCPAVATTYNINTTLIGGTTAVPVVLGDIKVSNGATLTLNAGVYAFNSLSLGSGAAISVNCGTPCQPVIITIAGASSASCNNACVATPIDFGSGGVFNPSIDASKFQILYPGTGTVKLSGGASSALVLYAPNAAAQLPSSNADFYGSVVAKTVNDQGVKIHYDRHLGTELANLSGWMFTSFSWKKY